MLPMGRYVARLTGLALVAVGLAGCGVPYGAGPALAGIGNRRVTLRYDPRAVKAAEVAADAADYCPDATHPVAAPPIRYQAGAVYTEYDCVADPVKKRRG
jgi:hypothetical protein